MKIDIFMSEFCGSRQELRVNLKQALADLSVKADVRWHTVTYDEAVRRGITGTPSLWINGKDAFDNDLSPGVM
jgi:hypothetical protein